MRLSSYLAAVTLLICAVALSAESSGPALERQVERTVMRELQLEPQDIAGIRLLASELRLPDRPHLHVANIHPGGEANTWLLRMECASRVECLPFEVVLRTRRTPAYPGSSPDAANSGSKSSSVVRSGQRVRVAEEISGMRLSTAGISLQAGSIGQKIRVRNLASGRVVLARVRAAGSVVVED